jgi:hypothetical protein
MVLAAGGWPRVFFPICTVRPVERLCAAPFKMFLLMMYSIHNPHNGCSTDHVVPSSGVLADY